KSGALSPIAHPAPMAGLIRPDCQMTTNQLAPARIRSGTRMRLRSRGGQAGALTRLSPGPAKRGVVGALAGVVPAELVVGITAGDAVGLNQLGKERMRVALDDFLLGIRRSRHGLDDGVQDLGNARAAFLALVSVRDG